MNNSVTLCVGDVLHLKRGKDRIVYGGMPSDSVYSIVQMKRDGYQGFGWNLFYPRSKSEITIDGVNIFVESVNPDEIGLRVG